MRTAVGAPAWRVVGASQVGTSHQKLGLPCQDAHHWLQVEGHTLVAAVADGAGSAPLAAVGAATAARIAVETLYSRLAAAPTSDEGWQGLLVEAFQTARSAVAAQAQALGAEARDLATTLVLAVATPSLLAAAQVGDGAVVVATDDGAVIGLSEPSVGEYLNETVFLTAPDALTNLSVRVRHRPPRHLALFTDGLQMLALKMPDGTPHPPFFGPLFRFVEGTTDPEEAREQLAAFLAAPKVTGRTDDDLTLVLATLTG